jgi:hypothetical protein
VTGSGLRKANLLRCVAEITYPRESFDEPKLIDI